MQPFERFIKRITLIQAPALLAIVVSAAFVLGIGLRFVVGWRDLPLWVDEAWTGAIAGQATLNATIRQSLLDANPPAYFILMHFWTELFGLSNAALRFPSFVVGAITPLIALIPTKGMERTVCLLWCGLVALWIPGIWYSQEARGYSLAFFLAMACTLAYVRLLTRPGMRTATGWVLLGSLAILTQYHSLLLVGCQGIGYLTIHRVRALRTWPAALFYLPIFTWIGVHVPRLLQYANPKAAAWRLLKLEDLAGITAFVFGDLRLAALLLIISSILGMLAWQRNSLPAFAGVREIQSSSTWLAAGTAAVAAVVLISVGALRPSFSMRYLMVFMPGILLGIARVAANFGRRWTLAPVGIVILYGIFACDWSVKIRQASGKLWNFEYASHELEKYGVDQLVFFLDSPITKILKPSQLETLGGFFFKRQGLAIHVMPFFLRQGDDPNKRLLADATSPHSGILWLYILSMRDTAAVSHPVRIEQIDDTWVCSNFGKDPLGVVACHRR